MIEVFNNDAHGKNMVSSTKWTVDRKGKGKHRRNVRVVNKIPMTIKDSDGSRFLLEGAPNSAASQMVYYHEDTAHPISRATADASQTIGRNLVRDTASDR
jgi:hypothetical protein